MGKKRKGIRKKERKEKKEKKRKEEGVGALEAAGGWRDFSSDGEDLAPDLFF